MSIKRHIKQGIQCPVCDSHAIEGGFVDNNGNYVEQDFHCNNCGATWEDVFKLSEVSNIEFGSKYQVQYNDETVKEYETMEEMKREILDNFSDGVLPFDVSVYNVNTKAFDIEIGLKWDLDFTYLG